MHRRTILTLANYLSPVKTRWEGTEVLSYSPLIYARDVEDVAGR